MYVTNWHWFMCQSISHCMQLSRVPGSCEPSLRWAFSIFHSPSSCTSLLTPRPCLTRSLLVFQHQASNQEMTCHYNWNLFPLYSGSSSNPFLFCLYFLFWAHVTAASMKTSHNNNETPGLYSCFLNINTTRRGETLKFSFHYQNTHQWVKLDTKCDELKQ